MIRRSPLARIVAIVAIVLIAAACTSAEPPSAGPDEANAALTLEYIAHASFLVTGADGARLLLDPYASRVWLGYDFPDGVTSDAVLVTHPHYDHDAGVFRGADFPWPDTRIIREPGPDSVGSIRVSGIEGRHADPYGKEFGQTNTIFVVEAAGVRIAHLGDNGPLTEENVRAMGRVDILLIPGDAVYHILSPEATTAAIEALSPRVVIPMHYRIGELELAPDSPSDLGDVDPWLEGRGPIRRFDTNVVRVGLNDLPTERTYWVLPHSPAIQPPDLAGN